MGQKRLTPFRETSEERGPDEGDANKMVGLIYFIASIFVVLWVVGFLFAHVGGGLIHLLLVVAVIMFAFNLLTGRRTV